MWKSKQFTQILPQNKIDNYLIVVVELRLMSIGITPRQLSVANLIRDAQQSTLAVGDINFNPVDLARVLSKTSEAGFKFAEVAGGQSFQSAIKQGLNPFTVMEYLDLSTRDAEGKRTVDLQMLFRGANALGFRHYSPALVEAVLNEFIGLGINKIRIFDALNDIDNIYIPESVKKAPGLDLQGALCFGYYAQQKDRYTNKYYLNYAQALLNKGCTSLAIKDMSGQLDEDRAALLVEDLKKAFPGIKVDLHIHSTDEPKSLEAIKAAIKAGVDGIETVEGPLSGGAAHHSLASIDAKYDTDAYKALVAESERVWGKSSREDSMISPKIKAKLCAAGVPGGAMPFVLNDLKSTLDTIRRNNMAAFANVNPNSQLALFDKAIELFLEELPKVCKDAGYPLLVTPTADICTKQAIYNLQYGRNLSSDAVRDRYKLKTPGCYDERFVKLVLGHYGQMKSYTYPGDQSFIQSNDTARKFFKTKLLQMEELSKHPYTKILRDDISANGEMAAAREKADKLIAKHGYKALSFASKEQLAMMYVLAPAGGRGDVIEQALNKYTAKNFADFNKRKIGQPFIGFENLFEPLFKHIDVLTALGEKPNNPLDMKISDFGKLGERMYQVYSNLPQIKMIRKFLENNSTGLQTATRNFQANYTALQDGFDTLFKQAEIFGAIRLKDLIIGLAKLWNIPDLIRTGREDSFQESPTFITEHLEKLDTIGTRLAATYSPVVEKQASWQVNASTAV